MDAIILLSNNAGMKMIFDKETREFISLNKKHLIPFYLYPVYFGIILLFDFPKFVEFALCLPVYLLTWLYAQKSMKEATLHKINRIEALYFIQIFIALFVAGIFLAMFLLPDEGKENTLSFLIKMISNMGISVSRR